MKSQISSNKFLDKLLIVCGILMIIFLLSSCTHNLTYDRDSAEENNKEVTWNIEWKDKMKHDSYDVRRINHLLWNELDRQIINNNLLIDSVVLRVNYDKDLISASATRWIPIIREHTKTYKLINEEMNLLINDQ